MALARERAAALSFFFFDEPLPGATEGKLLLRMGLAICPRLETGTRADEAAAAALPLLGDKTEKELKLRVPDGAAAVAGGARCLDGGFLGAAAGASVAAGAT